MNAEERARHKALANKATKAPWWVHDGEVWYGSEPTVRAVEAGEVKDPAAQQAALTGSAPLARVETTTEDAAFIAAARTAVPQLVDDLEAAEIREATLATTVRDHVAELKRIRTEVQAVIDKHGKTANPLLAPIMDALRLTLGVK